MDQKQLGNKENIYLAYLFPIIIHWRKANEEFQQDRNLGSGTEIETLEKLCLLACFLWFAQFAIYTF